MTLGRALKKGGAEFLFLLALLAPNRAAAQALEAPAKAKEAGVEVSAPPIVPRHFLRVGGRRIESGLRIESTSERVRVARRVFPQGGEPRGVTLPEHLGGGYLFFQPVGVDGTTYTSFYRAETWTGPLSSLGRIPFAVQHVALGFDRVYALGVSLQAAFDLETGSMLSLAPLPPLATISGLSFDGPRRGIVSGPLVGVLYTGDAGLTWGRVEGAESIEVDLMGTRLFVRTAAGLALVNEEGEAVAVQRANVDPASLSTVDFERLLEGHVSEDAFMRDGFAAPNAADSSPDLVERKWVAVLTRGAPYQGSAWAIEGGELLTLRLDGGLELRSSPTELPPTTSCVATVEQADKDASPLFLCLGAKLQAYRLRRAPAGSEDATEGTLNLVWEGSGAREVLTWGAGSVLLAGDCRGKNPETHVCHVSASEARSLFLPENQLQKMAPRAFAVTSKSAELVWLDRKGASIQRIRLTRSAAPKKVHSYELPSDHSIAEFLREGAILPRASVTKEGLSFWATYREKFVGVLLGDADKPSFGAVQRPLRRALFDGPRAILWGAAGFAKQSVDGGQTFEELVLPYRSGDAELAAVDHPQSAVTMGCTAVGCSLGRLLRLGWEVPEQTEEEIPEARPFTISGSTRYRFTCGGLKDSPPRRASEDASFPGFWEKGAPPLAGGQEGSSAAFPGDFGRFYAWGPSDTSWSRTGRAQVMFVDPWDGLQVRSSALTPQIFSSASDAQTRLGLADPSSGFRFLSMDPDGRGGVMIFRGAASTELYVFEEGQPLEQFSGAHELGYRNLAGAVRSRSSYVASFIQGPVISLVRLSGGTVNHFVDFNFGNTGQRGLQLVRSHRGDLGIAIEGDDGLLVYPVSEQGELGEPIVVAHESKTPPACSPEATGFIVDRELAVAPYLDTTSSSAIPVSRVRAKVIVGYGKMCIDSLRAQARGLGELSAAPPARGAITLSVFDADSDGRRSQFTCE